MLHRRLLTGTGIAFICAATVAGCFTSGENGDPGAGFLGGTGPNYGGTAGAYGAGGSGTAGARSTGGADAGTAGTTGEGSICGGFLATPDGGASADGATTEAGASTHDGAATSEAGASSDAGTDGSATTEAGATEAGATEAGATEAGATEAGTTTPAVCTVGAISFTWSLEQAGTTIAETCGQAGVATIRLIANGMNVDFKCGDGAGRTPALAAGTYAVSLHALDASGAAVSDTSTMNVTVTAGQIVSLGNAVFDVD
jgi:hypothetical protein